MRPPQKDPYGRPGQRGYGQRQQPGQRQPGYGQQGGYGQIPPKPGEPEQKRQTPPPPAQQVGNIKADIVWALKNAGGGMSVFDVGRKITSAGKPRYAETKIQHILEMMVQDGKVTKGEETGRVTYKWAVEAY